MKRQQQGFTLIELVVVIVILAILSAFALPRFLDLTRDARIATIEGVAGSMRSASSIVRTACSVDPSCAGDGVETFSSDNLDGDDIDLQDGYPAESSDGILAAAQIEDPRRDGNGGFTGSQSNTDRALQISSGSGDPMVVFLDTDGGGNDVSTCKVTYSDPSTTGTGEPSIVVDVSGC